MKKMVQKIVGCVRFYFLCALIYSSGALNLFHIFSFEIQIPLKQSCLMWSVTVIETHVVNRLSVLMSKVKYNKLLLLLSH